MRTALFYHGGIRTSSLFLTHERQKAAAREEVAGSINAMVETVFETIESELIGPFAGQSRRRAQSAVARYMDRFDNPVRRHSSLGSQSPIAFERKAGEVS